MSFSSPSWLPNSHRFTLICTLLKKIIVYVQGILGILTGAFGQKFFEECYTPVGELMDLMVLINSSTNFIFYLFMSSDFKNTVKKLCSRKTQNGSNSALQYIKCEVRSKLFKPDGYENFPVILN